MSRNLHGLLVGARNRVFRAFGQHGDAGHLPREALLLHHERGDVDFGVYDEMHLVGFVSGLAGNVHYARFYRYDFVVFIDIGNRGVARLPCQRGIAGAYRYGKFAFLAECHFQRSRRDVQPRNARIRAVVVDGSVRIVAGPAEQQNGQCRPACFQYAFHVFCVFRCSCRRRHLFATRI